MVKDTFNGDLKIYKKGCLIVLEKEGKCFSVRQAMPDDDVWFQSSKNELEFIFEFGARDEVEFEVYNIFYSLMKSIVGRYMLNKNDQSEWSTLPKDFIDLENGVITWHSDSDINNILKLHYDEDTKTLKITISNGKEDSSSIVRIRTSGSSYDYYYQEFLEFFRQLSILKSRFNQQSQVTETTVKMSRQRRKWPFLRTK